MRLFEAIVDANHRAVAGDKDAGLHPADFADEFPIIALTCIDPRLNALFPNVLGVPADEFIWLRNAGNIITSPLSSTMRSLALACAVKGGKEIAIIGHTDCQVAKTSMMQLLDKLRAIGVERAHLPENLNEFFGMFATERQNVLKACDFVRQSPLIGPQIPVHGLLVDIETGKLDWVVNGYESLQNPQPSKITDFSKLGSFADFEMGNMKFPGTKIGEMAAKAGNVVNEQLGQLKMRAAATVVESATETARRVADYAQKNWPKAPPKIPVPPAIRPRIVKRGN